MASVDSECHAEQYVLQSLLENLSISNPAHSTKAAPIALSVRKQEAKLLVERLFNDVVDADCFSTGRDGQVGQVDQDGQGGQGNQDDHASGDIVRDECYPPLFFLPPPLLPPATGRPRQLLLLD